LQLKIVFSILRLKQIVFFDFFKFFWLLKLFFYWIFTSFFRSRRADSSHTRNLRLNFLNVSLVKQILHIIFWMFYHWNIVYIIKNAQLFNVWISHIHTNFADLVILWVNCNIYRNDGKIVLIILQTIKVDRACTYIILVIYLNLYFDRRIVRLYKSSLVSTEIQTEDLQ